MYSLKNNEVAQTYLDSRIHELQSIKSLGKMSSSILHTLFRLAEKMEFLNLSKKLPDRLQQFESPNGVDFNPIYIKIKDKELPPMIKVKQYQQKFKK